MASIFLICCKKQENWLDIKSNKADIVPVTLDDFEALINNDNIMNQGYPVMGIMGADNHFMTYSNWKARQAFEQNAYIWKSDVYQGISPSDWRNPYVVIASSNVVLEGLKKLKIIKNKEQFDRVKGSALFFRAYAFYNLMQLFAKPYDKATAENDPGIPLRINSDINVKYKRATVDQCYGRIVEDLDEASKLLPTISYAVLQPSKVAALALEARVHLVMENYDKALNFSKLALEYKDDLLNFNELDTLSRLPFPNFRAGNKEIIFYSTSSIVLSLIYNYLNVDTILYRSYGLNDLRRKLFFESKTPSEIYFKGYYTGQQNVLFAGLSINELYLIEAECYARNNNVPDAMAALNKLLENRWKQGTFQPYVVTDLEDALKLILEERRKELPFNGSLRWTDLRRLNKDSRFQKTLSRVLNGEIYTLLPNDKRYVYPLPDIEIQLNNLEQNPR